VPVDGSMQVELLAQDAMVTAVERAVRLAEGIAGVPGVGGEDEVTVTSDP
jgi:propanediol utilization protein